MTDLRPVPYGQSADITTRQDDEEHTTRLRAYSRLYRVAQRWRIARALGALLLGAAPILIWRMPATTEAVAAAAGAWLILARTLLTWGESTYTERAVKVQELYDTRLFGLSWNRALAGREPFPDDIADAARHLPLTDKYLRWYTSDLTGVPWPGDVLLCQRESSVWSRGDRRGYGLLLAGTAVLLFVGSVIAGIWFHLDLAEYLIKLGLPLAPALQDAIELSKTHLRYAAKREQLVQDITDLWGRYRENPADIPVSACRRIQDEAFRNRQEAPRVPNWYYQLRRDVRTRITREGNVMLRQR